MAVKLLVTIWLLVVTQESLAQTRRLGNFREVFAWKQMTFNVNGNLLLRDRSSGDDLAPSRDKRQTDHVFFDDNEYETNFNNRSSRTPSIDNNWNSFRPNNLRPSPSPPTRTTSTTARPSNEEGRFFIQYNNVPMGMERVGNRLFVTLPRRRYGIPATLNYIDLERESNTRSPALNPYPDIWQSRSLTSVYRTRADECGRLWMVDTGLLELPVNRRQLQPPAIVVYDLNTDRQIFRYQLKDTDLPSASTPTGLASITVDVVNGDCANTFAYIPDLTTIGIIVFSLRENDSWRLSHNYFSFNPTAGNLDIAGHRFQWSDGIFSITLKEPKSNGCRTAYFHPLISTEEFSVDTCLLRNRTATNDSNYWAMYSLVGNRGSKSQSTMHGYHTGSQTIFFADIGRNAVSCWRTSNSLNSGNVAILAQDNQRMSYPSACHITIISFFADNTVSYWRISNVLNPGNVAILAQDSQRMNYPSDLHVTGDEVWVMANTLPRFGYSRLDTDQYNFYIYRGNVEDLIAGTVCDNRSSFALL